MRITPGAEVLRRAAAQFSKPLVGCGLLSIQAVKTLRATDA